MEPVSALLLFGTCVAAHPHTVSVVSVHAVISIEGLVQITHDLHDVLECDVESWNVVPVAQIGHVRSVVLVEQAIYLVPIPHVAVQDLHDASECETESW